MISIFYHVYLLSDIIILFQDGLEALRTVALNLVVKSELKKFDVPQENKKKKPHSVPLSKSSEGFLDALFYNDETQDPISSQAEVFLFQKNQEISKEISIFANMLSDPDFVNKTEASSVFWLRHAGQMPILSKLFILLSGISSSSAFVERLFSICGIIANKRNQNSKEDLFEMRAMLATNMELLEAKKTEGANKA